MNAKPCALLGMMFLLALPMARAEGAEADPGPPRPCTEEERASKQTAGTPASCTLVLTPARRAAPAPRRTVANCSPSCRAGYLCVKGSCVSPCNPACDAGEICAVGGECVPLAPTPAPAVISAAEAPPAPPLPTLPPDAFTASSGVGLGLKLSLLGQVRASDGGGFGLDQLEPAYGLYPFVDVALGSHVTLGAGASLTFNVRPTNERAPARKLDLVARITGIVPMGRRVRLFGRFAPGVSRILLLRSEAGGASNPYGFALGFEGGLDMLLSPAAYVTVGLAHDTGFHSQRLTWRARDTQTRYLQLFGGLGLSL